MSQIRDVKIKLRLVEHKIIYIFDKIRIEWCFRFPFLEQLPQRWQDYVLSLLQGFLMVPLQAFRYFGVNHGFPAPVFRYFGVTHGFPAPVFRYFGVAHGFPAPVFRYFEKWGSLQASGFLGANYLFQTFIYFGGFSWFPYQSSGIWDMVLLSVFRYFGS